MPITLEHKMKPREVFVYLMVSLIKDPTISALGMDRKTVILDELRKEFCPSVDDNDWASLQREIDKNQPVVAESLMKLMKLKDYQTLYSKIIERFSKRK